MRYQPGKMRKMNWLDLARHKARQMRKVPTVNAYWPRCNRCGCEVGAFGFEDRAKQGKSFEFTARCDHPEHQGSREDAIRVDFEWPLSDADMDDPHGDFARAMKTCQFFPRANDV